MFRLLLEDLGGLFIKFGQFIALRPDIASPSFVREAECLLDKVPPFAGTIAIATIEEELGRPIADLFERFDTEPVAAASFAQVHRAFLPDGKVVAVKVQRPGLEQQVRADLRYMGVLVWLIELTGATHRIRLSEMLDDFRGWTLEELDLRKEAAFASSMRSSEVVIPAEYIPAIYWSHTTRRVLTLEFLSGVWMSDFKTAVENGDSAALRRWEQQGIDRREVALNVFNNMLRQIFERNTFHADPHAGNLVILQGGRIGYVDFGITGQIDARFRDIQRAALVALSVSDFDAYFRATIKFFYPLPSNANVLAIRKEMIAGAREWANARYNEKADLSEKGTSLILINALGVARRHNLSVSSIALRYFRAVVTIEAMILTLDPQFAYSDRLKNCLVGIEIREVRRRNTPDAAATALVGLLAFVQTLPQRLARSLGDLDETNRTIGNSLNVVQAGVASVLRLLAGACVIASLVFLVNLTFGFLPVKVATSWIAIPALALSALLLASLARRLVLTSLPVSE